MKTLLFFFSFLFGSSVSSQVLINEIQSSNKNFISDFENDNPDWIELYNPSNTSVNLEGYFLSDDIGNLKKWVFPTISIGPKDYLVIYCSSKDTISSSEIHTNFKLNQDGESIILLDSNEEVIDQHFFDFIPTDQSWNRIPDGSDNFIISYYVTPRGQNKAGSIITNNRASGFYENDITIKLNDINPQVEIKYSNNGNDLDINSKTYTQDLVFTDASAKPNVYSLIPTTPLVGPQWLDDYIFKNPRGDIFKLNVLKYQSFLNNNPVSPPYNKSYFINKNIFEAFDFPVWSIVTDSLNLYDWENGIFIPGAIHDNAEWDGFWPIGNYSQRGEEWERPVHISYFDKNGTSLLETDAGLRMHGFGSATFAQKSMRLYFRSEYGMSQTSTPFFENDNADYYKRLILRNSGNDFLQTHFRDALLQNLIKDLNVETQNSQASLVFINGEYWGIYNIRERFDKYYFDAHYNIEEDSLIIVKECGIEDHGDNSEYLALLEFVSTNDLALNDNYEYVSAHIDLESYIDYHVLQIYFGNSDWPCNNYKFWKTTTPDDKWKPMIFDLDLSFGFSTESQSEFNTLELALEAGSTEWPNCDCSTLLFRSLFENPSFKNKFIERSISLFHSHFDPIRIINEIEKFKNQYANEMIRHIQRWGYPNSINEWENQIEKMIEFAEERPCAFFNHLKVYDIELNADVICQEKKGTDQFTISPNPSNSIFLLENIRNFEFDGSLTVYNTIGQLVYHKENITIQSQDNYKIDLSQFTKGMYTINLIEAGSSSLFKLILQ